MGMMLGGAFAVLVLVTLIILKFGRQVLQAAAETIEEVGNEGGVIDNLKETVQERIEETVQERIEGGTEEMIGQSAHVWKESGHSMSSQGKRLCMRLSKMSMSLGVKLRILVSLYQVLGSLGITFNIPYPEAYTQLLASIGTIELNLPKLLPLDCLLGGISFATTLVLQTAAPLVLVFIFDLAARWLRKRAARLPVRGGHEPLSALLADLCTTLSFILLFLLYPGSSSKFFNALLCVGFDDPSETGMRFLRVGLTCRQTQGTFAVPLPSLKVYSVRSLVFQTSPSTATRLFTRASSFRTPL